MDIKKCQNFPPNWHFVNICDVSDPREKKNFGHVSGYFLVCVMMFPTENYFSGKMAWQNFETRITPHEPQKVSGRCDS
jgi:hypothetical protein